MEQPQAKLKDFIAMHRQMKSLNAKVYKRVIRDQRSHDLFNLDDQIDALQKHIDALKEGR